MKNIKIMILVILTFLFNYINVYAECSVVDETKLTKEARNVKASFEIAQRDMSKDPGFNYPDGFPIEEEDNTPVYTPYFKIYITNLTENLYIEVKDSVGNEVKRYNYSDSNNGEIVISQEDIAEIHRYTVTVYASDKTECISKKLSTTYTTTPMFNYLTTYGICDGAEGYYACEPWLNTPLTDLENVEERINRYKEKKKEEQEEEKKKEEEKGFKAFLSKNRVIIIVVSICIIGIGGVVTVIIIKKQRSRVL